MTDPKPEHTPPPGVRAIVTACDAAATAYRYTIRVPKATPLYVIVPHGAHWAEMYMWAEGALEARDMVLDWRHHPDQLVWRAVQATLRLVAQWLPAVSDPQSYLGTAYAIQGYKPDGLSCPLCQHEPHTEDCPLRHLGDGKTYRHSICGPEVTEVAGWPTLVGWWGPGPYAGNVTGHERGQAAEDHATGP